MQVWKGIIKTYISALYAGLCVILAASIYLLLWSFNLRPLGAVLFSVGLIIIVIFGFSLYTGKIGYAYAKDRPSLLTLVITLLGNATAVIVGGYLLSLLRYTGWTALFDIIDAINVGRMVGSGETWYMALINGFFCGVLVFLAVHIHKTAKRTWVKYVGLVFFITTFVVFGTEHCLANMFFFSIGGSWNIALLLNVILVIIGNSLGAMFAYTLNYL
jgi:formate/nitrite transporter FocA (FNT family)